MNGLAVGAVALEAMLKDKTELGTLSLGFNPKLGPEGAEAVWGLAVRSVAPFAIDTITVFVIVTIVTNCCGLHHCCRHHHHRHVLTIFIAIIITSVTSIVFVAIATILTSLHFGRSVGCHRCDDGGTHAGEQDKHVVFPRRMDKQWPRWYCTNIRGGKGRWQVEEE
jgi:hypothetical protein